MPLYRYKCKCGKEFEEFHSFENSGIETFCPLCERKAKKIITAPNLITDSNFYYTGKVDKRLGTEKIEGRKDWKRKVAEKGFVELDPATVKRME
jgi:putative FmdB family regulatory protein